MTKDSTVGGDTTLVKPEQENRTSSYAKSSLQLGVVPEGQQPKRPLDLAFNKIEANISASNEAEEIKATPKASVSPIKASKAKSAKTAKKKEPKKKQSKASKVSSSAAKVSKPAAQKKSSSEEKSIFDEQQKFLDACWSIYKDGISSAERINKKMSKLAENAVDEAFNSANNFSTQVEDSDPVDLIQKQIDSGIENIQVSLKFFEESCDEATKLQGKIAKAQEKLIDPSK